MHLKKKASASFVARRGPLPPYRRSKGEVGTDPGGGLIGGTGDERTKQRKGRKVLTAI